MALQATCVALELIERADALSLAAPAFGIPDDQAAVEAAGDDQAVLEGGTESSGHSESTLVIDGVLELAKEERRRRHASPGPHFDPLFTTFFHSMGRRQPKAGVDIPKA